MASRPLAERVSAVGWRLLFAAAAAVLLVQVLATKGRHASVLLLAAAIALLLLDAWRSLARKDVAPAAAAFESRDQAQRLQQSLALLDAVTVALWTIGDDGRILFANRAARLFAGAEAGRLDQVAALKGDAAARILALPPGGRQLLSLADGRSVLVWTGAFAVPGAAPQKLVSLQAVAGELDAIQIGAWHSMTRVLAHEMMNSLTPIASLSESLTRIVGPEARPEVAGAINTIARQSRHLMTFVERYRTIADLPEPEFAPLDLPLFLADLSALAGSELEGRGIAFSAPCAPQAEAQADSALLAQALLNLLHNAAEAAAFVPEPQVRLTCTATRSTLSFAVSDNGPGVPTERMEEIFVPFFTTREGGAGIGLTLAREIALAHKGRLSAARGDGQGMTFTLTIPAGCQLPAPGAA
jgi:signal transduction histidine kinase